MSVHYKFKSALDFDTITFDGLHISVDDLKKAIVHQKRLGKTADFDLQITNAQTKEEYTDDQTLIPKNTSLIIARIPLTRQPKKPWDPSADKQPQIRVRENDSEQINADLLRMNGSEEDKINAMMIQSTIDYDPNNYQKIRGSTQTGEVPASYRCYKCHKPGHWIKNCPLNAIIEANIDVKRNTGIPRSFIDAQMNEATSVITQPIPASMEKKQEVPEDLVCGICKDLFTDAVMIPCCGSSFCDECVRTALLESEDNECPDCHEKGSSPGSLIPNRFLRNSVNAFKNETGYSKPRSTKPLPPRQLPSPTRLIIPVEPVSAVQPEPETIVAQETTASVQDESVAASVAATTITTATTASTTSDSPVIDDNIKSLSLSNDDNKKTNDIESLPVKEIIINEETRADTPHEESDYEDNITVTVPPAHLQSCDAFRDRHVNGRQQQQQHRHQLLPGMENAPSALPQHIQIHQHSHEDRSSTPTIDEKESYNHSMRDNSDHHHKSHDDRDRRHHNQYGPSGGGGGGGHHHMHASERQQLSQQGPDSYHQSANSYNQQGGGGGGQIQGNRQYEQMYNQPPQQPPGYPQRSYDHSLGGGLLRPPFPLRPTGPGMGSYHGPPMQQQQQQQQQQQPLPQQHHSQIRPRHSLPPPPMGASVAQVYQGVAAKIGTGIIDDPLEAFNRIMREKERRKEERRVEEQRRNSPSMRRRSRSRNSRSYSRSRSRSLRRHSRSPGLRKRSRSPLLRRHSRSPIQRRHGSRSPPTVQSRKRSRSPFIRRSRSRSPSFSMSRSRTRSHTPEFINNKRMPPIHNNSRHLPLQRTSPRNRFRDSRRPDRRDDYHGRDRDGYNSRERSPIFNQGYNMHRGGGRGGGMYRGRGGINNMGGGGNMRGAGGNNGGHYNNNRHDRQLLPNHHLGHQGHLLPSGPPPPTHQQQQQQQQQQSSGNNHQSDQYYQHQTTQNTGYNTQQGHHHDQYLVPPPVNNRYVQQRGISPAPRGSSVSGSYAHPPTTHLLPDPIRYDQQQEIIPPPYRGGGGGGAGGNRFDDAPPGTQEPPPPGFENAPLERLSPGRDLWLGQQKDSDGLLDSNMYNANNRLSPDIRSRRSSPDASSSTTAKGEYRRPPSHAGSIDRQARPMSRERRSLERSSEKRSIRGTKSPLSMGGGAGGGPDHHHHHHQQQQQQQHMHHHHNQNRGDNIRSKSSSRRPTDHKESSSRDRQKDQIIDKHHHHHHQYHHHQQQQQQQQQQQTHHQSMQQQHHHHHRSEKERSRSRDRSNRRGATAAAAPMVNISEDRERDRNGGSSREKHRDLDKRDHRDSRDYKEVTSRETKRSQKDERGVGAGGTSSGGDTIVEKEREHRSDKEKEKAERKQRDSSSEERRERRAKEKKKKKKEEKALEKKKKKERKDKEKRDKELRKEQERARKLLEARIDHSIEEDYENVATAFNRSIDTGNENRFVDNVSIVPPQELGVPSNNIPDETNPPPTIKETQTNVKFEQSGSKKKHDSEDDDDDDDDDDEDDEEDELENNKKKSLSSKEQKENVSTIKSNRNDLSDSMISEPTEFNKNDIISSSTPPKVDKTNIIADDNHEDNQTLDLYGDIMDSSQIDYADEKSKEINNLSTTKQMTTESTEHSPRGVFNRSDSILDLHDNLDLEIDDMEADATRRTSGSTTANTSFASLPELSKWERDEDITYAGSAQDKSNQYETSSGYDEKSGAGKVTNEVLKRAENAIFARAINAIRPIEIKKISIERQKLYANEKNQRDGSPTIGPMQTTSIINKQPSMSSPQHNEMQMQITVPIINNMTVERSVELKSESSSSDRSGRTKSPIRSVKDRLGSKIIDELPRSRTRTPPRKAIVVDSRDLAISGDSRRDKQQSGSSETRKESRHRDGKERNEDRPKDSKINDEKSSSRSGATDKEKDYRRDSSRQQDKEKRTDVSDRRDRRGGVGGEVEQRSGDNNDRRNTDSRKEADRRDRGSGGGTREREKSRDRMHRKSPLNNRDKERERAREIARARERERLKEMSKNEKLLPTSSSSTKFAKRDELSTNLIKDNLNVDEKRYKPSRDEPQKQSTSSSATNIRRSPEISSNKTSENKASSRENNSKRSGDRALDIDEIELKKRKLQILPDSRKTDNTNVLNVKESRKRSVSPAASSSSSSDSDSSDSSSGSEDKKRKKRKHKKTKRTRRASSSESNGSTSRKRKSKKKKSKKKKKAKK